MPTIINETAVSKKPFAGQRKVIFTYYLETHFLDREQT